MQAETAVSEATRVAMEDDEAKTKEFYRTELNMRREECVLIAAEEKALKELHAIIATKHKYSFFLPVFNICQRLTHPGAGKIPSSLWDCSPFWD